MTAKQLSGGMLVIVAALLAAGSALAQEKIKVGVTATLEGT